MAEYTLTKNQIPPQEKHLKKLLHKKKPYYATPRENRSHTETSLIHYDINEIHHNQHNDPVFKSKRTRTLLTILLLAEAGYHSQLRIIDVSGRDNARHIAYQLEKEGLIVRVDWKRVCPVKGRNTMLAWYRENVFFPSLARGGNLLFLTEHGRRLALGLLYYYLYSRH